MSADEFDDTTSFIRGEAFFEVVDAVIFAVFIWEALDAVEIVAFEFMFDGIFDHMPLD